MLNYRDNGPEIDRQLTLRFGPHYEEFVEVKLDRLQSLCDEKGINPTQLAKLTGISQAQVWRILKDGAQKRNIAMLYAISLVLHCDLSDIVVLHPRFGATISEAEFDQIVPRLREVRMVRSHLNSKIPVDLTSFYYKTVVSGPDGPMEVESLEDLPHDAVLIQGPSGQGKSIFLRYLALQAIQTKAIVPLYLELEHVHDETLAKAISHELELVGLSLSAETETAVLARGEIALLLDGLDGLSAERRASVLRELGEFKKRYPALPVVIASRPLLNVTVPPWLHVLDLVPLERADFEPLLRRFATDEEAEEIMEALRQDLISSSIRRLITSPVMVELLIAHFRRNREIPSQVSEFFNGVLYALMETLNAKMHGHNRPLVCGLNPLEFRRFFEALCFVVQRERGDASIHRFDLEEMARQALEMVKLSASPAAALDDVIAGTSLIHEELGHCEFAHPSIRCYFAALFVRHSRDPEVEWLYREVRLAWPQWEQTIEFLEVIDRRRCLEYLVLPEYATLEPFDAVTLAANYTKLSLTRENKKPDDSQQLEKIEWRLTKPTCYALRREALHGKLELPDILQLFEREAWCQSVQRDLASKGAIAIERSRTGPGSQALVWRFPPDAKCAWQNRVSHNILRGRVLLNRSPTLQQRAAMHRQQYGQLQAELDPSL